MEAALALGQRLHGIEARRLARWQDAEDDAGQQRRSQPGEHRPVGRKGRIRRIELADDRRGNPTPVDDAARVILAVLKQLDCQAPLWGTYHYGGQEATTALALGQAVLSEARVFRSLLLDEVKPQAHASRPDAADEPQHAVMACKKILHTFGVKPRAWRTALPQLLDRYYRHD